MDVHQLVFIIWLDLFVCTISFITIFDVHFTFSLILCRSCQWCDFYKQVLIFFPLYICLIRLVVERYK